MAPPAPPQHAVNLGHKPLLVLDVTANSIRSTAMADRGATSLFIDEHFARSHGFKLRLKERPDTLQVVDGRESAAGLIRFEVDVFLNIGNHYEYVTFQVTTLANYPMILGKAWFNRHDPSICWSKKLVTFDYDICKNNCN